MQGLRERGKDGRRRAILLAARDLIAECGLDALTMRALAERAGVSVPTIYGLIGPRDAVVAGLLGAGGDRIDDAVGTVTDPFDRLFTALAAFCAMVAENHEVARTVLAVQPPAAEGHDSMRARVRAIARVALRDAQTAGSIDASIDAADLADLVDALMIGGVAQWATGASSIERMAPRLDYGVASLLLVQATRSGRVALRHRRDQAAQALQSVARSRPRPRRHRKTA